ncbi:MAG TPA: AAA family ATPase [Candidatus Sulfotelmatobacter sp.]|jgi:exodeoxyribonuclease V alpha subunit|nr:AAA family ATPase [Candidatus Sulfotelmatobacter sp.]
MESKIFTKQNTVEKLSGIVKRITFHSIETGWTVLKINPFDQPLLEKTVVVHQSKVFAGATIDFYGNWTYHPKFGEQFKATKAVELKPATANALEKYLGSGLIKGVGPITAKAIVQHFGKDTLEVFDKKISRLMEVPNIAEKKLEMISNAWEEHKDIKDVMMFLQEYDISTLFSTKIYKTYGKEAISIVSENPYKLAEDIYGIGFFSADQVAINMGLGEQSEQRIQAAIDHVLASGREEGHCYLTKEQVIKQVNELLTLQIANLIEVMLDKMEVEDKVKIRLLLVKEGAVQTKCYYSHSIYFDEEYLAKKVKALVRKKILVDTERANKWISLFCEKKKIAVSIEQQEAIIGVIQNSFSILTGGPGVGKTTTTKVLVQLLLAMKKQVLLASPTGRASQRMTEVIGIQAKTIHRLLEWQASQGGFKKNDENPLKTDFLIIDESSMLDVHLAAALLRAVSSATQVLFIGDKDQLPAVGAGNVFGDLIDSKAVSVFHLTKIFRQAEASFIIRYAHEINKGTVPQILSPMANQKAWEQKIDCLFLDSEEATQEQLHFIKRVKKMADIPKVAINKNEEEQKQQMNGEEYEFTIPDKFRHVDIEKLAKTKTHIEELKEVLEKLHPWSTLRYGMNASETIQRLYSQTIPKFFGKEVEIQILSPMTKGSLGTVALNKLIQETINSAKHGVSQIQLGERMFRVGDRIIQRRNNYDLAVFNGDIGKIIDIDNEEMKITVQFPMGLETKSVTFEKEALSEIDLAYAITIHKSQGSEFEAIIIPITTQHFNMLFRNLIYTGLTRGKKLVVFVGSRKALAMAAKNNKTVIRQTALQQLL